MAYDKSGITSDNVKRYAGLVKDSSIVTVMDSENLGNGVETSSKGKRDMHSNATSKKHSPPTYNEGRREDSSMEVSDLTHTENSYGRGLYGTESTPMATTYDSSSQASPTSRFAHTRFFGKKGAPYFDAFYMHTQFR